MSENEIANTKNLKKLKELRDELDWEDLQGRYYFTAPFCELLRINKPDELRPNLLDIFRKEEIEQLMYDSIDFEFEEDLGPRNDDIIKYVARTGYRNEPDFDEDGKPLLRRTTAMHCEIFRKFPSRDIILELFKIYDRFDVNYVDEKYGYTHFHAACEFGCEEVVRKFLRLGQDPNLPVGTMGDSPLHLTLTYRYPIPHAGVMRLLLRSGADPNSANEDGKTPLHIICVKDDAGNLATMLFEICDERNETVRVNVRDKTGRTPLHLAASAREYNLIPLLLRRGAEPNMADDEGSTPLHVLCESAEFFNDCLTKIYFDINDELHQQVQVDAKDKLGRTPLQWAVATLQPELVDLLLDRGADLSTFVFLTECHFRAKSKSMNIGSNNKFRVASATLTTIQLLEKRGFEWDQSDVTMIMKLFANYELFEKSADREKCRDDNEDFVNKAKEMKMRDNDDSCQLSLYDLIQLRSDEAVKVFAYADYLEFARSQKLCRLPQSHQKACALRLSEQLSRGFFRRWALDPFLEVIRHRLPFLCCEMIIEYLTNEDLWHVCLVAAGQS